MADRADLAFRDGTWTDVEVAPLPVLATLAVLADGLTTAAFLALDLATEENGLLVAGLSQGPSGGVAVFVLTQGVLLAVAWLSLGQVSRFVGVYLVVTMGVGGGVNNAVLLATGQSLFAPLGGTTGYLLPPLAATVIGLAVVAAGPDRAHWPAVGGVAAVLLCGEVLAAVL